MNNTTIYIIEFVIAGTFARFIYADEEFRLSIGRMLKNIYAIIGTFTSVFWINSTLGVAFQIQDKIVLVSLAIISCLLILNQIKNETKDLHYSKVELKALKKINREAKQAQTGALIDSVQDRQHLTPTAIPTKQPTDFGTNEY